MFNDSSLRKTLQRSCQRVLIRIDDYLSKDFDYKVYLPKYKSERPDFKVFPDIIENLQSIDPSTTVSFREYRWSHFVKLTFDELRYPSLSWSRRVRNIGLSGADLIKELEQLEEKTEEFDEIAIWQRNRVDDFFRYYDSIVKFKSKKKLQTLRRGWQPSLDLTDRSFIFYYSEPRY